MLMTIKAEFTVGTDFIEAAREAWRFSLVNNVIVEYMFNDITCIVNAEHTDPETFTKRYENKEYVSINNGSLKILT